jgi:hypothetical protein
MSVFRSRINRLAVFTGAAVLSASLFVSTAAADIPALTITWTINDGDPIELIEEGTQLPNGQYNYTGDYLGDGYTLGWNLNAEGDPLISGNIVTENLTANPLDVVLTVSIPVAALAAPTNMGGSAALSFTSDPGGGQLNSLAGTPVWQALIDGSPVQSLFNDPFNITHAGLQSSSQSQAFGLPGLTTIGPAVNNTIGIQIAFSLSPLDQFSMTSFFQVVPAPGAMALLAFAGLAGSRRRRD